MRERIIKQDTGLGEADSAFAGTGNAWWARNNDAMPGAEPPYDVDEFTDLGTWHRVGVRAGAGVTLI